MFKVVGGKEPRAAAFRAPRASDLIARHLRHRIIRGLLKEGERLPPEAELIRAFKVSRPTLREAISILEAEGLISMQRGVHGGAIVHRPDWRMAARYVEFILESDKVPVTDVFLIRAIFEPVAARILAEERSADAPAILRSSIEEWRAKFSSDLDFGIAAAHMHQKLVELTQRPTLILLSKLVLRVYERYLYVVSETIQKHASNIEGKSKGLRAVEKLIDLIEIGDGPGAEAFWRKHMELNGQLLRKWLPAESVVDLLDD